MLIVFAVTAIVWFALERHRFQGPPQGVMIQQREQQIAEAERAVGQIAKAEQVVGEIAEQAVGKIAAGGGR